MKLIPLSAIQPAKPGTVLGFAIEHSDTTMAGDGINGDISTSKATLLLIIGEPIHEEHKQLILDDIAKGMCELHSLASLLNKHHPVIGG